MTITADIAAERAALAASLLAAGASAPTGCGQWTALDLSAHLVAEERLAGLTTFIARSLVVRGVAVAGPPTLVDNAIRLERRHGFPSLIDRLRLPVPRLLLRPRVAPLTLFEYWTHHDDLHRTAGTAHAAPASLGTIIPLLLHHQRKSLPAAVRVTIATADGTVRSSTGPRSAPEVTVYGTAENLVRWLAGRPTPGAVTMTGAGPPVQTLRAFRARV
ncbi:MAG: maleylpyruvate isomerase family mycothiol-dependent enzyme [Actinomycetota bacterium]|nr:maleylpyruvate isomerase family mycothiol-dependent enzyme [Actinomycetota bacterium]